PRPGESSTQHSSDPPVCAGGQVLPRELPWRPAVESKKGAVTGGHAASSRFPSPLIEPDLQISPIRLSDQLHLKAHGLGRTA
ncbi:MAG: hypothetical protein WAN75_30280, partial [Xanthobacteraceae bacterium]